MSTLLNAAGGLQAILGSPLFMFVIIIAIMYFMMIRPQRKQQKELDNFRNSLAKGQKVITAGGIHATVKEVKETTLLIEVDSNVTLRIDKNMVAAAPMQNA